MDTQKPGFEIDYSALSRESLIVLERYADEDLLLYSLFQKRLEEAGLNEIFKVMYNHYKNNVQLFVCRLTMIRKALSVMH